MGRHCETVAQTMGRHCEAVAQTMGRHCEAIKFTTFCYSERGIFGIFWQTFCGMYVSYEEDPYRDNFGSIRLEMMESELDY